VSVGELLISLQCWLILFVLSDAPRVEKAAAAGFIVTAAAIIVSLT